MAGIGPGQIPAGTLDAARAGEVPVLGNGADTEVRALVQLDSTPPLMMLIERAVDPHILDHMKRTEEAVAEYQRLDQNRSGLQVTFALIFAWWRCWVLAARGADRAGSGQPDSAAGRLADAGRQSEVRRRRPGCARARDAERG